MGKNARKKRKRRQVGVFCQQFLQEISNVLADSRKRREKNWQKIVDNHENYHESTKLDRPKSLADAKRQKVKIFSRVDPITDEVTTKAFYANRTARMRGVHTPRVNCRIECGLLVVFGMNFADWESLGFEQNKTFCFDQDKSAAFFELPVWRTACKNNPNLNQIFRGE